MAANKRIPVKWQLLGFEWLIAGFLAFYTLGALWEYADTLQASNGWMLKVGFMACETSIFIWAWWHVFRRWVITRVWCLVAACAMAIFLVVHATAVTKYVSAKKDATANIGTLATGLAGITGAASQGIVTGAGQVAAGQRQQGAPNTARSTVQAGTEAGAKVGVENGKTLAEAALKAEEQARNATFLSPEYLNGKMFVVVFISLIVLMFITLCIFEAGKAEEDDDNDGTPNYADIKSQYYDPKRATEYWSDRGQEPPHTQQASWPSSISVNGNSRPKP